MECTVLEFNFNTGIHFHSITCYYKKVFVMCTVVDYIIIITIKAEFAGTLITKTCVEKAECSLNS